MVLTSVLCGAGHQLPRVRAVGGGVQGAALYVLRARRRVHAPHLPHLLPLPPPHHPPALPRAPGLPPPPKTRLCFSGRLGVLVLVLVLLMWWWSGDGGRRRKRGW
eukprot:3565685-Rhodomonas_salina.1